MFSLYLGKMNQKARINTGGSFLINGKHQPNASGHEFGSWLSSRCCLSVHELPPLPSLLLVNMSRAVHIYLVLSFIWARASVLHEN